MAGSAADDWLRLNRENWDDRTRVHAGSAFYDLPGFRAGASMLRPFEIEELGDVAGKRLVHLQCHMGQDTLSWAQLGAQVTGVDLSGEAVRTARGLAEDRGLADRARFVVSDVYDAAEALDGARFDIVYTGLGALVWLPDLDRWAGVVASLLADGGVLYLAEFHPMTDMFGYEDESRTVVRDYFDTAPVVHDYPYTYTDGPELTKPVSVEFPHQLGEVVTAVARAGLRIEFLHEHDVTIWPRFTHLVRAEGDPYHRFPAGEPRLPLIFSLRAVRDPS